MEMLAPRGLLALPELRVLLVLLVPQGQPVRLGHLETMVILANLGRQASVFQELPAQPAQPARPAP